MTLACLILLPKLSTQAPLFSLQIGVFFSNLKIFGSQSSSCSRFASIESSYFNGLNWCGVFHLLTVGRPTAILSKSPISILDIFLNLFLKMIALKYGCLLLQLTQVHFGFCFCLQLRFFGSSPHCQRSSTCFWSCVLSV